MPAFTIPVATFMGLLAVTVVGLFLLQGGTPTLKPSDGASLVKISYDKQEQTVPTKARTVGELLDRLSIKLNPGDVVEPTENTEIVGDNFRVNVYRAVPVTVVDGGKKTFTYSAAATARSIVKRAGIEVYPEDRLHLRPVDNFLTESSIGERVVIERATPVALNLYGTPLTVRTHAKTVGELMEEKNIKMSKGDSVMPAPNTKITRNGQVFLLRKGMKITTEEHEIAMPIDEVEDRSLSFGTRVVRQQGAPGKKVITFQLETKDGKELSRKVIQEVIVQEPVRQVVAKGSFFDISADKSAVMLAAGISRSDFMYVDYIVSKESRWRPNAMNASSGAYGLCQALPGSKMASAGSDWQTNPITQLKWCAGYAQARYGGWAGAYNFWQRNHYW